MFRCKLLATAVALGATAVITVFGAASAAADSCNSNVRNSNAPSSAPGRSNPDKSTPGRSNPDNSTPGTSAPGMKAGRSSCDDLRDHRGNSSTDVSNDVDQTHKAPSSPPPPGEVSTKPEAPSPSSGTATNGPTIGGGPATIGAAGTETETVSTAPTPPNGAEPAAAGSPAPAELPNPATTLEIPAASPPTAQGGVASGLPDLSGLSALFGDALGAAGPVPVAAGLSPDATKSGVLVAALALAVLLFLAAYQLVDRRDRGLAGARDAEGVAQFK